MTLGVDIADGVCRCRLSGGRFLSTGFEGGVRDADAAYNVTVPEGWGDAGARDLRSYVDGRIADAGFPADPDAPALLTGVDQHHARAACLDGVTVVATAGLSNPAALPVETGERPIGTDASLADGDGDTPSTDRDVDAPSIDRDVDASPVDGDGFSDDADRRPPPGTVNVLVGTDRDLSPGALANLVAVVAEAKATTLLAATGFPGTTSDAVVVGSDPSGKPAAFSGTATPVGAATRVCVRDAILASLASRYGDVEESIPAAVTDAEYGVVTDRHANPSPIDR